MIDTPEINELIKNNPGLQQLVLDMGKQLVALNEFKERIIKNEIELGLARAAVADLQYKYELLGGDASIADLSSKVGLVLQRSPLFKKRVKKARKKK